MRKVAAILLMLCALLSAAAQEYITPVKNDLMPPTPQSWKPVEYQMPQPSLLTGAVDLSIPIYTITAGDYSLPIYMQYHSNGIKVTDDPIPYGFGWTLMPALRATRTVMGRPDEYYDYMYAPSTPLQCFQCIANYGGFHDIPEKQCDSQHDIMTFSLPSKTVTAILDYSSGSPKFVCAMADEYKISADNGLTTITVIDPHGVKYIFGGPNEIQPTDDLIPGGIRTAWAMNEIVVNATDTIALDWELRHSNYANPTVYGGGSFMDKWTPYLWGDAQGGGLTDFETDDGESANFSHSGFCDKLLSLKAIKFSGGELQINRGAKFVESLTINDGASTVKTVALGYDTTYNLLTSLRLSDEGQYNFDYDMKEVFTGNSGQDWWGFFNGKTTLSHTPAIRIKQYANAMDVVGSYLSFGHADRSPDAEAMKTNLITKVIYPTGGYSQFKYEPHRFAATRDTTGQNEIDPAYNPLLNMGGGVRVSEITMASKADGSDAVKVKYNYSDAIVRAVPSMSTFIDIVKMCKGLFEIPNSSQQYDIVRLVHINMNSSYMRYDIGETPLWYESVRAVYPEGKIEYRHGDVLPSHNIVSTSFGYRAPSGLYRVFSPGLQLVEKTTYKRVGSAYAKVEAENFDYENVSGTAVTSCYVIRNTVHNDAYTSPDFVKGEIMERTININTKIPYNPYNCGLYNVVPYIERLTSKSRTVYTDNGSFTTTESYTYKSKTSLISSVTRTTSDGKNNVITVSYPSASGTAVEKSMIAANVVGKPVKETFTHGTATVKHTADYVAANGNFSVTQTSTAYGGSTDKLLSPVSTYHNFGRLSGSTDADGISAAWLWGYDGVYPVYKVDGYSYSELLSAEGNKIAGKNMQSQALTSGKGLVSKILYKKLVGPTSVATPSGITTTYGYDLSNRLSEVRRGGTLLQRYGYMISHTSENSIQADDYIADGEVHTVVSYYDGLGRESRVEDKTTGIRTFKTYDGMGRLAKVSVPQVDDPDSYAWTLNGYEASPRNMLVMKTLPGQLWHSQNKSSKAAILTNTATGTYSCYYLTVNSSDGITMNGSYAAGKLMVEETTDEDGYVTRTFTDLDGKVIKTGEGRGTDFLYTYNVYDDYGRLRYVLPPNIAASSYAATSGTLAKKAFIYKYDSRGRLVYTKTPGCAPEEIRYSPAGRVVARHTPAMASGQWMLYLYDRYGREVIQTLSTISDSYLKNLSNKLYIFEYTGSQNYGGYYHNGAVDFPFGTLQKVTYYDNYDFASGTDADLLGSTPHIACNGLVTGVRDFTASSSGLTTVTIYNSDGFVAAVNSRMLNGKQMRTFTYDRRGKVLTEREVFTHVSGKTYVRVTTNTYDKAERLVSSTVVENGKTARIERTYGKNGLLSLEKFGNKLNRRYTYDIHGWLTSSTLTSLNSIVSTQSDSRTEEYYSPLAVGGSIVRPPSINVVNLTEQLLYTEGATPLYSGCPSAKMMISGGRYDYTFDNHRRLTKAAYTPKTSGSSEDFSVEYAYDAVASPQYIKRKGIINVTSKGVEEFGILDELGYSYEGNQLTDITQLNQGVDFYGRTGYAPKSGTYTWNEAGLLNSDSSRGILSTTYNHLGLPKLQKVSVNSMIAQTVFYTYNCDGQLLSVSGSTPRYYAGSRIFEGNALEYSYFPGGYFDAAGAAHYTHTDYQGSIIAVTDSTGKVVQKVDYYPYGEPWREPSGQPMLFSGKERTALADYRFGPRSLSAATGLWSAPDIFSSLYSNISPYSYCAGNPVYYIDPSGMVIEAKSQKEWESLRSKISKTLAGLEKNISEIENKNWTAEKKAKKIGDKKERVASLENTLANMGLLEASDQVYALNRQYSKTGSLKYDKEKDLININYANTSGFVHELTHAIQYEHNEIVFDLDGDCLGIDVFDEIEAYKAQYAFSPQMIAKIISSTEANSFQSITADWLYNIQIDGQRKYAPGGEFNIGIQRVNLYSTYETLKQAYPTQSIPYGASIKKFAFKYKK